MEGINYPALLKQLRTELTGLYQQREQMERRIAKLRQTVVAIGSLCGEGPSMDVLKVFTKHSDTLTAAVMNVVVASDVPLDATGVRDTLRDIGYDVRSSNPLASIHSVMKRLREQQKIRAVVNSKTKDTAYVSQFVTELADPWIERVAKKEEK